MNSVSGNGNKTKTINSLLSTNRQTNRKNKLNAKNISTIPYKLQPRKLDTITINNSISAQ